MKFLEEKIDDKNNIKIAVNDEFYTRYTNAQTTYNNAFDELEKFMSSEEADQSDVRIRIAELQKVLKDAKEIYYNYKSELKPLKKRSSRATYSTKDQGKIWECF